MKHTMWAGVFCGLAAAVSMQAAEAADAVNAQYRPRLFKQFGDHVNTPDGLAQDRHGNIFMAAPNFVDASYPGAIMKMDKKTGPWSVFVTGLIHPETGRGAPMGMEFAEGGHLYYCDNQDFKDKNYKSRGKEDADLLNHWNRTHGITFDEQQ